jgi:predicted outer membrane repeat protein
MNKRTARILAAFIVSSGVLVALLVLGQPVHADPGDVLVDRATGTDQPGCGTGSNAPCYSIKYAVEQEAVAGDRVLVAAGTYTETFNMQSGVDIESESGAAVTFIDGEGVRGPLVNASGSTITSSAALQGFTIQNGTATNGGGVYITNNAAPVLADCIIRDNQATGNGGGIYVNGSLTMTGTQVISNTANNYGGGLYQSGAADRVNVIGGRFERNVANTTYSLGSGGGLYVAGSATLSGTYIISNTSMASGGGLRVQGSVVLTGAQVTGNTASNVGGGLYVQGSAFLTGTQVISNTAGQSGGGLYQADGNSQVDVTNSRFERNVATTGSGGGLRVTGSATLTGTQVISNTAYDSGGGLYANSNATLKDCRIERNVANGGAVNAGGGGLWVGNNATLTGTQVVDNVAARDGGGLRQRNSVYQVRITGGRFEGNMAVWTGGGLYVEGNAFLTETQVVSNTAKQQGGGLYQSSPTGRVDVTGSRFERNVATINGGGLRVGGSTALTSTQVVSNTAGNYGGGLHADGDATLEDCRIERNVAGTNGGGLWVDDNATLTGTQVISNTADDHGGGLWQDNGDDQLDVTGGCFEGNAATTLDGGGLRVAGSAALTGTQVTSNTAGRNGGGLYGVRAVEAVNVLFAANTASSSSGSAIYLEGYGTPQVTLRHLTIASATLGSGSAIYVAGGTVDITNTIVASYTIGLQRGGGTVNEDYNLFFGNGTDLSGSISSGGNSLHGQDPHFVDPAGGDYHIETDSAALDAGAFLSITTDLDGDTRPTNPARPDAPDIGCDENVSLTVYRPVTSTMTFGAACAQVVFTDTGGLSSGFITITVEPGRFPTANPADQVVSRTVTITPSTGATISATLALCYEDSEVKSGLDESRLQLYRRTGSGWQGYASTVDTANNLVTGSDVAAFSPWAMGDRDNGPTAVELSSFTADWDGERVLVAWETALEIDTVGFNLWRSTAPDGPYARINDALIPAASPGGVWGGSYAYVDSTAAQGTTYYYKLEEVEVGDTRNWYGPASTDGNDNPTVVDLLSATTSERRDTAIAWWLLAAAIVAGASLVLRACLHRARPYK